jgi:hypothetical protein
MLQNPIESKFYKQLKAFMKDLILVFPDDRDIKVISSSLNIAMMDDPDNRIILGFYDALSPYQDLIERRDDAFFYQDSQSVVNKWPKQTNQYQLFNKLNIYWETLHEQNRKIVWDYFQVIFGLAHEFVTSTSQHSVSSSM